MHWSEWLAIGIFAFFVLAALGHLIQMFTGPHRIRSFFLAMFTPMIGGAAALAAAALLAPTEQENTAQKARPPLPEPEWARSVLPALEYWIGAADMKVICAAIDVSGRRYIHCAPPPYRKNAGKYYYVFRMKDGALWPSSGLTLGLLETQKRKGGLPKALGGKILQLKFLRDGGPAAGTVTAEIQKRLAKISQ
jgi:hypothetical protein